MNKNPEIEAQLHEVAQRFTKEEAAHTATIIQRDLYHDIADELAERISKITGVEIGEHSSNNDPWMNAKYAADEYLAAPASAGVEEFPLPESQAARDVLAERKRQIEKEGWTPEHDDEHTTGAMATAAACYALSATLPMAENEYWRGARRQAAHALWPWDREWWKPTPAFPRRMLVKAGALILAEIERLDRSASLGLQARTEGKQA